MIRNKMYVQTKEIKYVTYDRFARKARNYPKVFAEIQIKATQLAEILHQGTFYYSWRGLWKVNTAEKMHRTGFF